MYIKIVLIVLIVSDVNGRIVIQVNNKHRALDESLYEDVLDADQCHQQIRLIRNNSPLQIQFTDAGIRTPRGVAQGNFVDMGNYHQCLGITRETGEMSIQGKYCTITVPLSQNFSFPWNINMPGFDPTFLDVDDELQAKVEETNLRKARFLASTGIMAEDLLRSVQSIPDLGLAYRLAICIPKPCSTQQAITSFLFNVSAIGFQYRDDFCRLPDDKPWSPADTVATVLFSTIGILTLVSTSCDLINAVVLKKDPKQSSRLLTMFSAYTNGRRLMNFSSAPGTLHCLDGIRTWAMMWVVVGHSFSTEVFTANIMDVVTNWLTSYQSLWISSATITVDTFFCLAGLLLVYTTAGKVTGVQLLKGLPLFYLNRLLRLFPLLAAAVLLQASFFNRMSDGPYWATVEDQTNYCRNHWWLTLLHVQNFIGPTTMCIPQSWYIAIDVHLYLVSPLVLFWVLGSNKKVSWGALVAGLLASVTAGSVYSFLNNFPSGTIAMNRIDMLDYYLYYYFNTLTRASPFFVGMFFGFVLHVYRKEKVQMPWISVASLWTIAASVSTTIFFYPYFMVQPDWDNQLVDNIMNSFMRPAWSASLCWMIFACTHGYGGPVNWFLTLDIWKLPARISYATFIFHYPLMFTINGSAITPAYFTVPGFTFKALAHITLSIIVAYFATLLIDAPFSTLFKILLDRSNKKSRRPAKVTSNTNSGKVTNNTNSGKVTNNTNSGKFTNNTDSGNVTNNMSSGKVTHDANSGNVTNNMNSGKVTNNADSGNVTNNTKSGKVTNDTDSGNVNLDELSNTIRIQINGESIHDKSPTCKSRDSDCELLK